MTVGARFDLHRLLGRGLVEHVDGSDAAVGHALHLGRPARGHVARLDPVVHDRAVEVKSAGDFCLATEDFDEAGGAIHERRRLACQDEFDKADCTTRRETGSRLPKRYRVTMSFFIEPRAASSSFFSRAGTLNLSSDFTRSSTSAPN